MKPAPPTPRDLRFFGLVMLMAWAWGAWRAHRHGLPLPVVLALAGVGGVILGLSLVAPGTVRPLYRAWMALGHALGRMTTPVMLAAVFALVLVPVRALLWLLGRDVLSLRWDRTSATYWSPRARPGYTREDFERLS